MIGRDTTQWLLVLTLLWTASATAQERPAPMEEPTPRAGTGIAGDEAPTDPQTGVSPRDAPGTPPAATPTPNGATGHQGRAAERVIEQPAEEDEHDRRSEDRRHERTVAIRVGAGVPYLFAIKYGDGSPCESADPTAEPATFCSRLGEPFLDLELSYSVTNQFEVAGYVTLALTDDDAALAKARIFGIGLRAYTSAEAIVKGFFGTRLVLDLTRSNTPGFHDFDLGLHGSFGIQIEPIRWMGIYLQGGLSVRVLRNFSFLPEASGGLQFRFP